MIKTKASLVKNQEFDQEFKIIKFKGLAKLPKTRPPKNNLKESQNNSDEEFEAIFGNGFKKSKPKQDKNQTTFDKARKEVMNFGISGSSSAEKHDQITELLIKLGAKPAKNKARNYKEILEEKRKQKLDDQKINKRTIFGTSHSLQYKNQKKKSRKDDGLLKSYGRLDKESIKSLRKNSNKRKR